MLRICCYADKHLERERRKTKVVISALQVTILIKFTELGKKLHQTSNKLSESYHCSQMKGKKLVKLLIQPFYSYHTYFYKMKFCLEMPISINNHVKF